MMSANWKRSLFALALAALAAFVAPRAKAGDDIVVFAAASLKNALDDVAAAWRKATGGRLRVALAGSSTLARQIQQGAPADLFISANIKWMAVLERHRHVDPASRRDLLRNRLVLVAHGKAAKPVTVNRGFDIVGLLGGGKLAMAMVASVPAGIYGKAALTSLDVWEKAAPHVAQTDNVRAALALVARGEAPFGIVYATDAAAAANVKVAATFPAHTHPPIIYPAAIVAESKNKPATRRFLAFLTSPNVRRLFERKGFIVIEPAVAN